MSIRRRLAITLATVTLVFAVLAAGVAAVSSWRGYEAVEYAGADLDAERVAQAVQREADGLALTAEDWSFWDDTLAYMRGERPEYEAANLVPATFVILGLSDVLLADANGTVVWSAALTPDGEGFGPVDEALVQGVRPGQDLHAPDLDSGTVSIRQLEHGLAFVSHQPITDSEGEAPVAGTLVMVRHFEDALVEALSDRVQRSLAMEPYDPAVPVRERTDTAVISRVPLGDSAAPLAVLAVTTPRDVSAVGRNSIIWMTTALVALLLTMGAVTLAVVDRMVVRRLVRLRDDSGVIGRTGVGHAHDDGRGDELNDLVLAVNHMIGSLSHTRQDLELRNAELAELARVRQDLVAMFSHELRTPLTTLLGFASTLRDHGGQLDDAQRNHFLQRIEANAQSLNRLVGDLLVLSRADDGAILSEPEAVDLAATLRDLADDLQMSFTSSVAPDTMLFCDPDHLRRILGNLLENARRYGDPPFEVTAGPDGERFRILVSDHGTGVPAGFAPHLFERFTQASTGDRRTSQGVGLGLAIVRLLASANGGEVRHVPSETGAVFEVVLPSADRPSTAAAPMPAVGCTGQ